MRKLLTTTFVAALTIVSVFTMNPASVSAHSGHSNHKSTYCTTQKNCQKSSHKHNKTSHKKCTNYKDHNHNKKCDTCGKKKSHH